MSTYHVLQVVTGAIKQLLWDAFKDDQEVKGIVVGAEGIVTTNPKKTAESDNNKLSVWLYHVTENEFVKNQPVLRANGGDRMRFPPLALDLSYLITPMVRSDKEDANHLLLGKTMQILYDNATTLVVDPANDIAEELHIVLSRPTILELAELWEALQEDYRLSVCYQVRVARVDSGRVHDTVRVIDRAAAVGHLTPEAVTP